MVMLKDRIVNKESGFLFYGLTPPKINTEEDKIMIIADKQIEIFIYRTNSFGFSINCNIFKRLHEQRL